MSKPPTEKAMPTDTLSDFMARERERLNKLVEEYTGQIAEVQGKLSEVYREIRAIEAYENIKNAKDEKPALAPRKGRAADDTPRAPRGSKREELITLIRQHGTMSRGQILERLGIVEKDNKPAAQSVTNALAALKKGGQLLSESGNYSLPTPGGTTETGQ